MGEHVIEFDCECESCKGTGLYVGMAEREGSAVVCHTCKGTGKTHRKITYRDFEGRKKEPGVQRVVQANPGIVVGRGKTQDGKREYELSDFGGMPYSQWLEGVPFPKGSEMRKFTCPCWWYQSADYKKKPKWDWCSNNLGRSFFNCTRFDKKDQCWNRWDVENA